MYYNAYSRCKIRRLVIDQEDWRVYKKKEKTDVEPQKVEKVVETNEEGEEMAEVLEEETEFEKVETSNKVMKKRKVAEEADQPPKKKRKYDNIMNWGKDGEMEDIPDGGIRAWLIGGEEAETMRDDNIREMSSNPEPRKIRQMEIEFVKRVTESWQTLSPEMVPEGGKEMKKKKTLKKLAKENMKVSNCLVNKSVLENVKDLDVDVGNVMEIDIEQEINQPSSQVLKGRRKRDE